jgi:mRNA-degrading endonuclease toxin of MazEF toxin-antitoxin module
MQSGDIVWVRMVDPNGVNEKVRPVVVLTPSDEISAGSPVVGVCITTTLPNPLTDDYVELPWHPQGRVRTGLRRRCAALCTWLVRIDLAQAEETRGRLSGDKLQVIRTRIGELVRGAGEQSDGDTPANPP